MTCFLMWWNWPKAQKQCYIYPPNYYRLMFRLQQEMHTAAMRVLHFQYSSCKNVTLLNLTLMGFVIFLHKLNISAAKDWTRLFFEQDVDVIFLLMIIELCYLYSPWALIFGLFRFCVNTEFSLLSSLVWGFICSNVMFG